VIKATRPPGRPCLYPRCRPRGTPAGSAVEMEYAGIVIVEPTNVKRAGVAGTHFPALPIGGSGRGAAVGRNFADRQRFAAVLDGGGGSEDRHGRRVARM
jgi:hypothetical protein